MKSAARDGERLRARLRASARRGPGLIGPVCPAMVPVGCRSTVRPSWLGYGTGTTTSPCRPRLAARRPDARSIEVMEHHVRSVGPATPQRQPSSGAASVFPWPESRRGAAALNSTWLLLAALVTYAYRPVGARQFRSGAASRSSGTCIGFGFVLCLLGSVLLHELGHALTACGSGIGVRGITLEALGGYTEMDREARSPRPTCWSPSRGRWSPWCWVSGCAGGALLLPVGSLGHQLAAQSGVRKHRHRGVSTPCPGCPWTAGGRCRRWCGRSPGTGTGVSGSPAGVGRAIAVVDLAWRSGCCSPAAAVRRRPGRCWCSWS